MKSVDFMFKDESFMYSKYRIRRNGDFIVNAAPLLLDKP